MSKKLKEITLVSGKQVDNFVIALTFNSSGNRMTRIVDFLSLFQQYVKGDNLKYFAPTNFKKFIVKNGNIYWGKNEEVIFPTSTFLKEKKSFSASEQILYVI